MTCISIIWEETVKEMVRGGDWRKLRLRDSTGAIGYVSGEKGAEGGGDG